jgi:hypothetical protein
MPVLSFRKNEIQMRIARTYEWGSKKAIVGLNSAATQPVTVGRCWAISPEEATWVPIDKGCA